MTDDEIAALRAAAEKATPDGWWDAETLRVDCGVCSADAAYIAAASPAVVLALLAEREALRAAHAENDRLLRLVAHDLQGRVDASKLGAIMQCADRARAALSGSAAP